MNAAQSVGERRREVRLAARAWEKAGWVDAAGRAEIDRRFADDRSRLGVAMRALVCLFTWFAVGSGFGVLITMFGIWEHGDRAMAAPLLVLGALCAIGAEVCHGALRTSGVGADDGLEISALGYSLAGLVLLFGLDRSSRFGEMFAVGAVLAAVAAWRWGGWLFGALAAAGLFLSLGQTPIARLAWFVVGAALVPALIALGDWARLAPSQRAAARSAMVLACAAWYAAVNYASLDRGLIELAWNDAPAGEHAGGSLLLSALATALLPVLLLAIGVRRRDRLVIGCGLILTAASVVTLRWYVHVAPLWVLLLVAGTILGGAALSLRRWLHGGPAHERRGFTAEALLEGGRRQLLEVAAAVAAFTPAAQVRTESPGGFEGGGGASGGGGATSEF